MRTLTQESGKREGEAEEERGKSQAQGDVREGESADPAATPECNSHSGLVLLQGAIPGLFLLSSVTVYRLDVSGGEGMQTPRHFQLSLQMRCLQKPEGNFWKRSWCLTLAAKCTELGNEHTPVKGIQGDCRGGPPLSATLSFPRPGRAGGAPRCESAGASSAPGS